MRFVGLDVHKRIVEAAILDADGRVVERGRFDCTRDTLTRFAQERLRPDDKVALEATTNTWAVVTLLQPHVAAVVVSNPLRTKAIAEAKVKTDKVDALVLAQLLRCDYLPAVWRPDDATRELRSLTSRRAALVSDRTTIKNRIHAVLHQRLIPLATERLFGTGGLAWLQTLELDEPGRRAIDSELRLLEAVETELQTLHVELVRRGDGDPRLKLLMTLPGVGLDVAQTLLATLGDIRRFKDGDHAASYLGLVPSTKQSAEHCYHGPITKRGKGHARWLMVQAAQHVASHPGPLGVFFRRLAKKKSRNVAVVATARKLVVIAWHMLTHSEPYRYALPRTTQTKLAKLRVETTGKRRRGGNAKGAPRSTAYGTGRGTRSIPSRDQVYAAEGLPPCHPLPPGERRVLSDVGAAGFLENISKPRRVSRRPAGSEG